MDEDNNVYQVYNECDREVAMHMRKQILYDVCLCRKYGQSFPVGKRCPSCQEMNTSTKPRQKQEPPDRHMYVYKSPAVQTQDDPIDPKSISNVAEKFSGGSNHVLRKIMPKVIPPHEFLNRYYLPCLMDTDNAISQMAMPKSLAKYFKEEDNLTTSMKRLNICDNVK